MGCTQNTELSIPGRKGNGGDTERILSGRARAKLVWGLFGHAGGLSGYNGVLRGLIDKLRFGYQPEDQNDIVRWALLLHAEARVTLLYSLCPQTQISIT